MGNWVDTLKVTRRWFLLPHTLLLRLQIMYLRTRLSFPWVFLLPQLSSQTAASEYRHSHNFSFFFVYCTFLGCFVDQTTMAIQIPKENIVSRCSSFFTTLWFRLFWD